jgi:hypothetical protein
MIYKNKDKLSRDETNDSQFAQEDNRNFLQKEIFHQKAYNRLSDLSDGRRKRDKKADDSKQ